jgi:subtilisin family serine protease
LNELDNLSYVLKFPGPNRDDNCPPVKVAILDTGVFQSYFSNSIKDYRDFVSGINDERQDGTGHGTSCLQLLLSIYEDAEVYIGRVFESDKANDDTSSLMAKVCRT